MAKVAGVLVIGLSWAVCAYLLVYYAVLLYFGPDALHQALGERRYNAIVAGGGLAAVLGAAMLAGVWALPLVFSYRLVRRLLRRGFASRYADSAIPAAIAVLFTVALHGCSLDGWPTWLFPLVFGDDAEFSPTYSPVGFWLVRRGMEPREVRALAGEPLERDARAGEDSWLYSRSRHSNSYRFRAVVFRDGRVVKKYAEYYVD